MGIRLNFSGHIRIFPERQFSTPLPLGCVKYQGNTSSYSGNDPSAMGPLRRLVFRLGGECPGAAGDLIGIRAEQAVSAVTVLPFGIIAPVNGN